MKNVQIIDGAKNCTFSIFQATESEFRLIFPDDGQEIQFSDDLKSLPSQDELSVALKNLWTRPVRKKDAMGIHGTLFFQLARYKNYYRWKAEDGIDPSAINSAQRELFDVS